MLSYVKFRYEVNRKYRTFGLNCNFCGIQFDQILRFFHYSLEISFHLVKPLHYVSCRATHKMRIAIFVLYAISDVVSVVCLRFEETNTAKCKFVFFLEAT